METVISTKSNFKKAVNAAKNALYRNEVIVIPTETVYGIAALASSNSAVLKAYKIKGRPLNKPMPLIAADIKMFKEFADFNDKAITLARKFWPGPLTLVVKRGKKASDIVTAGRENVAVRVPNHYFLLTLLKEINEPLAATSANISGNDEPVSLGEVPDSIKQRSALGIDADSVVYEIPSTIIDTTKPQMPILRPGPITGLEVKKALEERD